MNGSEATANSTRCPSDFTTAQDNLVAAISAATALVSFFACVTVIFLFVLFKKYLFFTQRLILYLTIAALLSSISTMLHKVDYKVENRATRGFCVFAGFFDQNTFWFVLMAICCITVNLLLNAVFNKKTERLEWVYLSLIFAFPFAFNWIPFIKVAYGKAGVWCWIRSEHTDCSTFIFGLYLRFILWYVPLYVLLGIMTVIYIIIAYKLSKSRQQWAGKFDPDSQRLKEQMQKEILPLIWYPLIYFLLNIFPLLDRIHDIASDSPSLALWILAALTYPLQGGFIALAFTLDPETLKRLRWNHLKAALKEFGHSDVREYDVGEASPEDSLIRRNKKEGSPDSTTALTGNYRYQNYADSGNL